MLTEIRMAPIGFVRNPIQEAMDDVWGGVIARIELDGSRLKADSLAGLDEFSHVEILFVFDQVKESEVNLGARHPRGRKDWPATGIFAQRAKARPNRIGSTV